MSTCDLLQLKDAEIARLKAESGELANRAAWLELELARTREQLSEEARARRSLEAELRALRPGYRGVTGPRLAPVPPELLAGLPGAAVDVHLGLTCDGAVAAAPVTSAGAPERLRPHICGLPGSSLFAVAVLAGPRAAVALAGTSRAVFSRSPVDLRGRLSERYARAFPIADPFSVGCMGIAAGDNVVFCFAPSDAGGPGTVIGRDCGGTYKISTVHGTAEGILWAQVRELNGTRVPREMPRFDVEANFLIMMQGVSETLLERMLCAAIREQKDSFLREVLERAEPSSTCLGRVLLMMTENGTTNRDNVCCRALLEQGVRVSEEDAVSVSFEGGPPAIYSRFVSNAQCWEQCPDWLYTPTPEKDYPMTVREADGMDWFLVQIRHDRYFSSVDDGEIVPEQQEVSPGRYATWLFLDDGGYQLQYFSSVQSQTPPMGDTSWFLPDGQESWRRRGPPVIRCVDPAMLVDRAEARDDRKKGLNWVGRKGVGSPDPWCEARRSRPHSLERGQLPLTRLSRPASLEQGELPLHQASLRRSRTPSAEPGGRG